MSDAIRSRLQRDAEAGALDTLEAYQARFPGHETFIAHLHAALRAPDGQGVILEPASRRTVGPEGLRQIERRDPEVLEEIARGGMGIVYAIRDDLLRRDLAMKKVTLAKVPEGETNGDGTRSIHQLPSLLRRLLEEAQITAQLDHSGVVPVHELGIDGNGHLYFTMKRVRGRTLAEVFRMVHSPGERWSLSRALQVFIQICQTLAYAHGKGVIHRDLKPANVMVGRFGEVYVMDWGLAKVKGSEEHPDLASREGTVSTDQSEIRSLDESQALTLHGDVLGTMGYMAPEQARGERVSIDERTDIYAVGAMLYELLSGHPPYRNPDDAAGREEVLMAMHKGPPTPLRDVAPEAPRELVSIVERAMAPSQDQRFQRIEEVSDDLHAFLDGRVVKSHETGVWIELKKWVGRNQLAAGGIVVGLVVALVVASAFVVQQRDAAVAIGRERDAAEELADRADRLRQAAQESARRADGARLAAQARLQAEHEPSLAVSLALAAQERAPGRAALDALYRATDRARLAAEGIGHERYVHQAQFTPDGKLLVTFDQGGQGIVWDVATGAARHWLDGAPSYTEAIAISGDGRLVASAHEDGTLQCFDLVDGSRVAHRPDADVHDFAFVGTGRAALVAYRSGRVAWRDDLLAGDETVLAEHGPAPDKEKLGPYIPHVQFAELPATAPLQYWWGLDGRIMAFDAAKRSVRWTYKTEVAPFRRDPGYQHALSADERGTGVAMSFGNGRGLWLRAEDGSIAQSYGSKEEPVHVVRMSLDGSRVFASSWRDIGDPRVRWFRTRDGTLGRSIEVGPHGELRSVSPDGRSFVVERHFDGEVWDADRGIRGHELHGHRYRMRHTAFDGTGRWLATVSDDMVVRLWHRRAPGTMVGAKQWHREGAHFQRVSLSGRLVLMNHMPGEAKGQLVVVDARNGEVLHRYDTASRTVHWVDEVVHDDVFFAVDAEGHVLRLDGRTGEMREVVTLEGWTPHVATMRVSLDRKRVFAAQHGHEAPFVVWRLSDGAVVKRFGLYSTHTEAAWSPDHRHILVSHSGRRIAAVYDTDTGEAVSRLEGHTGYVMYGAWHPSGDYVATSAVDSSARIWEARTGKERLRILGLGMSRQRLTFHPERDELLTCGERVRRWRFDLEAGEAEEVAELPGLRGVPRPEATYTQDGEAVLLWHVFGQVRRLPLDPVPLARSLDNHPLSQAERRHHGLLREGDPAAGEAPPAAGSPAAAARIHRRIEEDPDGAEAAIDALLALRPRWGRAHYLKARLLARRAQQATDGDGAARTRALASLAKAVEFGIGSSDRTLRLLRADPEWKAWEDDRDFQALRDRALGR